MLYGQNLSGKKSDDLFFTIVCGKYYPFYWAVIKFKLRIYKGLKIVC